MAHAFFGFNVLVTAFLSAMSVALYHLAFQQYLALRSGPEAVNAVYEAHRVAAGDVNAALDAADAQDSYKILLAARLAQMSWFYRQPFSFMPGAAYLSAPVRPPQARRLWTADDHVLQSRFTVAVSRVARTSEQTRLQDRATSPDRLGTPARPRGSTCWTRRRRNSVARSVNHVLFWNAP